jgi:AmmeMemoRadiSam system protein B
MKRSPAVAGRFYPGEEKALVKALQQMTPHVSAHQKRKAFAVVLPHAGYPYSGRVAAETLAGVEIPQDILILGPNHHGHGLPVAMMNSGAWDMPMGEVPINEGLAALLKAACPLVGIDEVAHRFEHSLEVQVPFLQFFRKNISIVPLVLSMLSYDACVEVGLGIAAAIKKYDRSVLLVASTDMSHYESRQSASEKDKMALDCVLALDPEGLYKTVTGNRISMCGIIPTTITLIAAKELGAGQASLVRYTDSGETTGDISQVVGYAGLIIA